jgi:hypothetical protein
MKLVHKLRWQSDCYMFHARHTWIVPHCHTQSNGLCHSVPHLKPYFLGCHFAEKASQTSGRSFQGQLSRRKRGALAGAVEIAKLKVLKTPFPGKRRRVPVVWLNRKHAASAQFRPGFSMARRAPRAKIQLSPVWPLRAFLSGRTKMAADDPFRPCGRLSHHAIIWRGRDRERVARSTYHGRAIDRARNQLLSPALR